MNGTGLETGRALEAGRDTRGWFVGDLIAWATGQGIAPPDASSPRQTSQVQVKWYDHPPGDARTQVAPPDAFISLSILIDGDLTTDFEHVSGERTTITLSKRGEYVTWHGPSYSHRWRSEHGATVLTVRWPANDPIRTPERLETR